MATNILRLTQLAVYLIITSQLVFYMFILSDALKEVSIDNFAALRKSVDLGFGHRFKIIYYAGLALSLATLIMHSKDPRSVMFISSCIGMLCLIADIIIAMTCNIPINLLFNNFSVADTSQNWPALRVEWLKFINTRGIFISVGMLSQLGALIFSSRS